MRRFRVIDTGVREGRANIAFDQALIDLHRAGDVPDTIRFLRFPPTALVGRHQSLSQEIRLDYCGENGIGIARRITGGGAIYFDEGQLGWELVLHRDLLRIADLGELARTICEAAATGLNKLGVAARFRPRNDIEVDGRKISGTGGFFDGSTLFYQGTLLIDMDAGRMAKALKVPQRKLAKRQLDSAEQRVVTLRELMGQDVPPIDTIKQALLDGFREGLNVEVEPGSISQEEERLAQQHYDEEIGTDEFVAEIDDPFASEEVFHAVRNTAGGEVNAYIRLEGPGQRRIREVLFTGDFFVAPPRIIYDLEAALRGVEVGEAGAAVDHFFEAAAPGLMTMLPADFRGVLESALENQ